MLYCIVCNSCSYCSWLSAQSWVASGECCLPCCANTKCEFWQCRLPVGKHPGLNVLMCRVIWTLGRSTRGIVVGFAEYGPLVYAHGTLVILSYQHGGQFGHGKGGPNSNHQGKSARYALWCHVYAYVNVAVLLYWVCILYVYIIVELWTNIWSKTNIRYGTREALKQSSRQRRSSTEHAKLTPHLVTSFRR